MGITSFYTMLWKFVLGSGNGKVFMFMFDMWTFAFVWKVSGVCHAISNVCHLGWIMWLKCARWNHLENIRPGWQANVTRQIVGDGIHHCLRCNYNGPVHPFKEVRYTKEFLMLFISIALMQYENIWKLQRYFLSWTNDGFWQISWILDMHFLQSTDTYRHGLISGSPPIIVGHRI